MENKFKQECIRRMKKLNIYKPYIDKFEQDETITLFNSYFGYYISKEADIDNNEAIRLQNKIDELAKDGFYCYAVTHTYAQFGECYEFLCVSKYTQDWYLEIHNSNDKMSKIVFAYVYNLSEPEFSEFGDIVVSTKFSGIRRIG